MFVELQYEGKLAPFPIILFNGWLEVIATEVRALKLASTSAPFLFLLHVTVSNRYTKEESRSIRHKKIRNCTLYRVSPKEQKSTRAFVQTHKISAGAL